jgi:hypothetical protein
MLPLDEATDMVSILVNTGRAFEWKNS